MKCYKVILDTKTDVQEFVNIANTIEEPVYLQDDTCFKVDAKSFMGVLYGKFEFEDIYVISAHELLYEKFSKFIV